MYICSHASFPLILYLFPQDYFEKASETIFASKSHLFSMNVSILHTNCVKIFIIHSFAWKKINYSDVQSHVYMIVAFIYSCVLFI